MRILLLIAILQLNLTLEASPTLSRSFRRLSRPEKWWVLCHPFKAKRAFLVTTQVRHTTDSLVQLQQPDTLRHGGRIDAFRHSYWMAMLTQSIGEQAARKLGKCHEKGNKIQYRRGKTEDGHLQDATACEMDLHNNETGIELALRNPDATSDELTTICLNAIQSGNMKVLFINASGEYCDCDGNPVCMVRSGMDKWKLPICLTSSK